ncbi:alpha/beta fold hydrolase [Oceanobacillus manasiensis]|uniref:alpha/beta fold hydrolase n=1 Tax=Oceanobacillus manasiensis TaxID=586413 RepID=UPI0005AB760B|nr:alpha/beta hydrolase [Oceanobacillus manasiensis]
MQPVAETSAPREGIKKKEFIEINGLVQGMFIEGEDIANPLLLFLHGGPGYPGYPFIKNSHLKLEKYFTVCYWDQRGTGMSFHKGMTNKKLSSKQLVEDTASITTYLCERFNKEKVYLFGHSWGSFLGCLTAAKYPHLFHAYMGSGQIGSQADSEKETLQFLLQTAIDRGEKKAQQEISQITLDENYYNNTKYGKILFKYLIKYGGGMKRDNYSNLKQMKELLFCKSYSLKERMNILRGSNYSYSLYKELAKNDLTQIVPSMEIPVYIFQGKHDYQTSYQQAKRFFDNVQSPKKKFFTFENSSHSPFIEEVDKFCSIVENEILVGTKE